MPIGEDLGACPFCGKSIGFTRNEHGVPDGVVHEVPYCDKFITLDPIEFMVAVRREREEAQGN